MKILYDYQIMHRQKYGGISRYFYEIITRIEKDHTVEVFTVGNINYYFKKYFKDYGKDQPLRRPIGSGKLSRLVTLAKTCYGHYDIIHPTYYHPYLLKRRCGKLVVTVHDMIHEIMLDPADPTIEYKREIIRAADHLIAVSENTKQDLLRFYPEIPETKISVIYHGTSMKKNENPHLRDKLPEKYILFVGQRQSYKNFRRFMSSVVRLLHEYKDLYLVCVGGGKFSEEEIAVMEDVHSRVHQLDCDDDMASAAYTNALCFVFPSLYEGFGIPTLEAFACDCPVVLADNSCMREVGADASVYFDAESEDSIYSAVRRVVEDPELRQELKKKGRLQLAKFNWDDIAVQVVESYKKACGNT